MTHAPQLHEFAPAKINLSLEIKGRRLDGYHELVSLVAFASVGDQLSATSTSTSTPSGLVLDVEGTNSQALQDDVPNDADNILIKAARALQAEGGVALGAKLSLEKNLPVAAGIGGGSADAAAALRLLSTLWDVNVAPERMGQIALQLGADVPVCLAGHPTLMTGIGDVLSPKIGLPVLPCVLVNPRVSVPTGEVFRKLNAPMLEDAEPVICPSEFANVDALCHWLEQHPNDLEAPARAIAPIISEVLELLSQSGPPRLVRMSGSGATCFGLYDTQTDADRAAAAMKAQQPTWWIEACQLTNA
ncbi:MAG: 4-(cytidine 5'-diphospho)-2-C-methyl-D-erythritol kinase [Parvibaculaceae bacterium]|nr:4-(cytidine 5'-diphospho)-2-C-methyl-D-erythritol kinase [Parvibaculaceae bacterium]